MFSPTIPPNFNAQTALRQLPIGTKLIFSQDLDDWLEGNDDSHRASRYWVTTATGIRMVSSTSSMGGYVNPWRDIRTDFPYTVVESAEGEVFYARGSVQSQSD